MVKLVPEYFTSCVNDVSHSVIPSAYNEPGGSWFIVAVLCGVKVRWRRMRRHVPD